MGLLALDVTKFGVVMSADSQPVELLDRRVRVPARPNSLRDKPIVVHRGGGFAGLVGYVGREKVAGVGTRVWLERFSAAHRNDPLQDYCRELATELTDQWRRQRLKSALIIFASGVEGSEVRFWFIHNTQGLSDPDWTYIKPTQTFQAIDDLDQNYVAPALAPGQTKEQLLEATMFFFRNGILRPTALIFDAFNAIMRAIYVQQIPGFAPIASLDDLAFFDRQRLEFAKRVFSTKHGISALARPPLGGDVHVLGVERDGTIKEYGKHRGQTKAL